MQDLNSLLKHLRDIHLAFALAAAAIFMALSSSNTVYETAQQQLRDLLRLSGMITAEEMFRSVSNSAADSRPNGAPRSQQPSKLEEFVMTSLSEYLETMETFLDFEESGVFRVELKSAVFGHIGTIAEIWEVERRLSWFESDLALLTDGETLYTSPSPFFAESHRTVADYQSFLDRILAADRLYVEPTFHAGYFGRSTLVSQRYQKVPDDLRERFNVLKKVHLWVELANITLTDSRSRAVFQTSQGHVAEDPAGYDDYDFRFDEFALHCTATSRENGRSSSFDLILPVMFRERHPDFIVKILQQGGFDDAYYARYLSGARSFDRIFPELAKTSTHLRSLLPTDLERYLEDQKRKSGGPIRVLGLDVDRDLIEVWGVLFMLSIQLYFCMHYRTFLERLPSKTEILFPWIGIYRHRLPALVFQVSAALPLAVSLFAALRGGVSNIRPVGAFSVVVALALFVWIEVTYFKSQRILATHHRAP